MTEPPRMRVIEGGDVAERSQRDRAYASGHAANAMDQLVTAEHGSLNFRDRGAHRDVARVNAEVAGVYATLDLARSNRELAAAYEGLTDELRARRERS